ncbi:MAG: hypothetical protein P4L99_22865 [Chthoniobacter sp.]|nr:hypothetical protein [Chthoniobacter sp.]
MNSARKQPHVLKIVLWAALPAVVLVLIVLLAPFGWGWEREHRWQAYRQTALAAGTMLDLPALPPPIDPAQKMRYVLAAIEVARYDHAQKYALTGETYLRQAQLAIALERFRRAHGALPERLSEVVPQYLPCVLLDPLDGEEMRYARDAANRYRLWSVGLDQEDDGGKVKVKKESESKEDEAPDDIVWPGTVAGK